jgi:hypothetical protein
VFAHVDEFRRSVYPAKCRFHDGIGISNESHHGAIRACPRIDVQQRNAIDRLNRIRDLTNYISIAALGKIRHAFNQFPHIVMVRTEFTELDGLQAER